MTSQIEIICRYHKTRSFGTRENMIARTEEVNGAYRDISEAEIAELVQRALAGDDDLQNVLASLACLHPGCLKPFHQTCIEREIFYPALIYHDADEHCATEFANLIASSGYMLRRNHLLLCMAWAGNAEVQSLFSHWRESQPAWAADLHVPPHAYAHEAGWDLLDNGGRRDLFFTTAMPLVTPAETLADDRTVSVGTPTDHNCQWCGRQFVSMLDIHLTSDTVSFLKLSGTRLRVTTCDVCSCYGIVFSKNDGTGGSTWHPSNSRPAYLPDNPNDWDAFPERPLVLSGRKRNFMESASWTYVPGVAFSQIGGLPTWIQDAEYPDCPECSQTMLFIGQISNEDFDPLMEGIQYCFVCPQCNVTATSYQQS
jgi:hypothetical protein